MFHHRLQQQHLGCAPNSERHMSWLARVALDPENAQILRSLFIANVFVVREEGAQDTRI